jgi:hypothetical protein
MALYSLLSALFAIRLIFLDAQIFDIDKIYAKLFESNFNGVSLSLN